MHNKFEIQDKQYVFPYHHIPYLKNGSFKNYRSLNWGLEYLCYLNHIQQIISNIQPSSVLDVGCGDGRLLGFLGVIKDIKRKVGVDLSNRAIQYAKAFNCDSNIEFLAVDASKLDEQFDVVLAIEVLEHIPDQEISIFLTTLAQRTKANGYIVISVPTTVAPVNKKHFRHYDLNLLEEQIKHADVELETLDLQYVYFENWVSKLYRKFMDNRLWFIDFKPLSKLMWHYAWNKLRIGNAQNGKHLIAVYRKI